MRPYLHETTAHQQAEANLRLTISFDIPHDQNRVESQDNISHYTPSSDEIAPVECKWPQVAITCRDAIIPDPLPWVTLTEC